MNQNPPFKTPLNKLKEWILDESLSGMLSNIDTDKTFKKIEELLKEEQTVIELSFENGFISRLEQKSFIDGETYYKNKFETK